MLNVVERFTKSAKIFQTSFSYLKNVLDRLRKFLKSFEQVILSWRTSSGSSSETLSKTILHVFELFDTFFKKALEFSTVRFSTEFFTSFRKYGVVDFESV